MLFFKMISFSFNNNDSELQKSFIYRIVPVADNSAILNFNVEGRIPFHKAVGWFHFLIFKHFLGGDVKLKTRTRDLLPHRVKLPLLHFHFHWCRLARIWFWKLLNFVRGRSIFRFTFFRNSLFSFELRFF